MSASEKLKTLDAELCMPPLDDLEMIRHHEARESVVAVLPQIVAVVETAEETDKRTREIEQRHELSPNELSAAMRAALAALDEALS